MDRQIIDKPIGFNIFNPDETFLRGSTYRMGLLKNLGNQKLYMTLKVKDPTVDVSGCYIGFAGTLNFVASDPFVWVLNNGFEQPNHTNIADTTVCPYLLIYPQNQATFNKLLARFDICVNIFSPSTSPHPHNGDYVQYGYNYGGTPIQQTEYTVMETCGQVDLGSLNWDYYPTSMKFRTRLSDGKYQYVSQISIPNYMCNKYKIVSVEVLNQSDKALSAGASDAHVCYVDIKDSSYDDPVAFKQAMSGVILTYELATPKPHAIKNVITI